MNKGSKALWVAASGFAMVACHKQQDQAEQNIVVDNGVMDNADIEALPPDESSGTPSDQLENGDDNADVSDLNVSGNAN